ncbi:MAG: HDIG domain-containing protein [Desulfobacterales bacterium]|nr:HDIG domain-containing protein [Desulfobacterales bacterium]
MTAKRTDISLKNRFIADTAPLVAIMLAVTVVATLILYPKLIIYNRTYDIGDIADKNIKAPKEFLIEDQKATRQRREQAKAAILTVYDYDRSLNKHLSRQIKQAFSLPRSVYETNAKAEDGGVSPAKQEAIHNRIWELKPEFEKTLGITVNNGAYRILQREGFSPEISGLIIQILSQILNNGVVANKDLLLRENDKGIVLETLGTDKESIVHNLKHFYGVDQAKTMVRIIGEPMLEGLDYSLLNLIVDFTQRLIQPNVTLNRSETQKRREEAADLIKPILYKIKEGEMILREGERITPTHMLRLQALKDQGDKQALLKKGVGTALIILALLTITYFIHLKHQRELLQYQNKNLFFIGFVVVLVLLILQLSVSLSQVLAPEAPLAITVESIYYSIPIAAGAMTICQFLGFTIAFPFAIVMGLLSAMAFENSYGFCLYFLMNGVMGAYWSRECKENKGFIMAGAKLGAFNILLATIVGIYMAEFAWFKLPWDWTFAFSGGIIAGIITAGVTPMMEMAFGYTTDSTLLELSNLDKPLLRRLMLEAPGTYHHSVIVGSMVEAAATEIGANPVLAKVCGYYHDIGKLKNPAYFIENQKNGKNIHNKLAPSMSCLILISHIKNGVELAREKKLGQEIIDAIKQHHGTTLITYFYEKARKQRRDDSINIDNFRYPGPKPQTRETALVMLADVVEAAARSLEHPTPSRIQGLVQQLINKLFSDNQLDECPLTLTDLHKIARSFNKILNGIYHHRVEYPDKPLPEAPKPKNDDIDREPAESVQNINGTDTGSSPNPLKRLGQS